MPPPPSPPPPVGVKKKKKTGAGPKRKRAEEDNLSILFPRHDLHISKSYRGWEIEDPGKTAALLFVAGLLPPSFIISNDDRLGRCCC